MKTKLIILLCALTGVLNTYATIKEINDSTIKFTTSLAGIGKYTDSTKYNTYIMDGNFLTTDIIKVKDYYDSLIVNFDLSKVKLQYLQGFNTVVETRTFPNTILPECPNLRVIKFPVNCDTINANVFGGSGKSSVEYKLDSIYITNETKILTVTPSGISRLNKCIGNYYTTRVVSGDSIVVMVPRALYSAYKAKTNSDGDWFRFKIVAYDVTPLGTPDASLSSLSTSFGTMIPSFSKDIHKYNITIPHSSQTNPTISATATNTLATVTQKYCEKYIYNSNTGIPIYDTLYVSVLASDGITYGTDTITFAFEPPSTDATLKSLKFDVGTLSPAFSPSVFEYELIIPDNITKTPVITEVLPTDSNIKPYYIDVDTTSYISCSYCTFNIYIQVTAEDRSIYKQYKIKLKNESSTGINQTILEALENYIYPTITKDVINIKGVESGQISIIDISGNTMIRDEIKSQINVSALPKGLYLVNINNQCVGKFIKQ